MVNFLPLLLYLFSVSIALTSLYLCFLLHRRFQFRFLLNYLYFLAAFFVAGFIDLLGRYLTLRLLSGKPAETIMLLNHILVFLMFPFIPLAIYLFISFIKDFLQKKISPVWFRIYAAFWSLCFLTLVVATKNFLSGQNARFSGIMFSVLDKIPFIFYLLITAFLFLKSRDLKDINQKRASQIYSLIYFIGFALTFIYSENWIGPPFERDLFTIFFYFSLNLPPLLYLRYYLRKFPPKPDSLRFIPETELEGFYLKYRLSKREQEIIQLMLKGKSNKDITQELFISLHTVKNHTYHIYQKLEVKNRLQLTHLIQNHLQNKTK